MNERREVTYFTDRDLGRKLPETLKAFGFEVETHDNHFDPLTPDERWLATVGARGWLAITRDGRIRYSPLALRVLMQTGARLFVLVGNLTTAECAELVVSRRKQIESLAAKERGAFIAKIRRDGVHLWVNQEDWKRHFAIR
jgi:hypothetical protein